MNIRQILKERRMDELKKQEKEEPNKENIAPTSPPADIQRTDDAYPLHSVCSLCGLIQIHDELLYHQLKAHPKL